MGVEATAWAWRQPLDPGRKLVLLAMADACADDQFFGSVRRLGEQTGLSRSSVYAALHELAAAGYIVEEEPQFRRNGSTTTTRRRLAVGMSPRPESGPPPVQNLDPPRPESGPPPVQNLDPRNSRNELLTTEVVSAPRADYSGKGKKQAGPVPPSMLEWIAFCAGLDSVWAWSDDCRLSWSSLDAVGWMDSRGRSFVRWESVAPRYLDSWKKAGSPKKAPDSPGKADRWIKELAAVLGVSGDMVGAMIEAYRAARRRGEAHESAAADALAEITKGGNKAA